MAVVTRAPPKAATGSRSGAFIIRKGAALSPTTMAAATASPAPADTPTMVLMRAERCGVELGADAFVTVDDYAPAAAVRQDPEAVVLDLVNPAGSRWRMLDRPR